MKPKAKVIAPEHLSRLKSCAIEAALASGKILAKHFGKKLTVSEKPGAGLVSNADLESEAKCSKILRRRFPEFGQLSEESPPTPGSSSGRWIVDPLDGTTNYVRGFPMFCVSIAAEWEDQLVVGVIYHPLLRHLYVATHQQGATLNGKKIHVSATRRLNDSLLATGFTYRKSRLHAEMALFERLSARSRAVRRPGSAAMDLAYTAQGVFDTFWEQRLSPWDVAAGVLLVQEAGGVVSDYFGNPFTLNSPHLVAANAHLHPLVLKQIK